MSGMFWNTMMCSNQDCTRIIFIAEAVGFFGIPALIAAWCCCNWGRWQRIEAEREAKRERLINKTRTVVDPVDRNLQYGSFQPMELDEGRAEQRSSLLSTQGAIDSVLQLHRSGEVTGANIKNVPDF